ncbi:hypothetical protein CspeluHIS016_0600810 [Cutaneotrichosporon spelunceum]|uniref:Uncharacterized protein n=1 Tax=Cutaneotrichosporon spelunceum TaxID=1672016 RepID=A0AAD3TY44_9TREE|nr:hypothetical protein CspeluHIS016_0600810 [Cutaneotrichosporon spelunceum]
MLGAPLLPLPVHFASGTPYASPPLPGTPYSTTPPRVRTPFPPRDRERAMTSAAGRFTLAMYPDIADAIILSASYSTQTTLRQVCAYFRERIDTLHCTHIALRTAMCRSPLLTPSLRPRPSMRAVSASGVHLVASRPDRVVRHDADRIWGYFYCGNAVPGLGFGLAFGGGILYEPPERQKALLKHVCVLDVYANDIDWEFAGPRAQLDATISALDPSKVHTVRFAEEADPWWYTRTLAPRLVVFDLRHFDAARPGKHSTHSYSLSCPVIPPSAATVVIHVPIVQWRFASPPLTGFIAHEGTERIILLFRRRHADRHRADWDGVPPPLGVLHKLLQDNHARFPGLELLVVGADGVDPSVFGRALDGEGSVGQRLARSVRDSAGALGWNEAVDPGECIKAMGVDEFQDTVGGEWETYTQFPQYE